MAEKYFVKATIGVADSIATPMYVELGEFHAVWKNGVSIGSDPGCTLVLKGLAPVAARVVAASNHKVLYRLPEGTTLPLPPVPFPLGKYDSRVDEGEFKLGEYVISVSEFRREE